jgi:hypothetical protein
LAEFGDKNHRLWQMGLQGDHKMPGIVGEGNAYYKAKFEKWARHIIDREKKLLSNTEIEGSGETSFMPGVSTSEMMKLNGERMDLNLFFLDTRKHLQFLTLDVLKLEIFLER